MRCYYYNWGKGNTWGHGKSKHRAQRQMTSPPNRLSAVTTTLDSVAKLLCTCPSPPQVLPAHTFVPAPGTLLSDSVTDLTGEGIEAAAIGAGLVA